MKTHAFVFARGGSKGIPHKNIRILEGKPLLAWSIEMAKSLPEIDLVFVSTDDLEIGEVARAWDAEVITRPTELAQDDAPEWLAWQHAVREVQNMFGEFGRFLSLPATSPLRRKSDVQSCLDALNKQTDMVVSITEAAHSPWFNMVTIEEDSSLKLLFNSDYRRRQDVPLAFNITTVAYVTRPSFILNHSGIWSGIIHGVKVPRERAVDIDTPFDLRVAEILMQEQVDEREGQC